MKNLILHGFPDGDKKNWDLREIVIEELENIPNFEKANIYLPREIVYTKRLGKETGKRPILIEFANVCIKREMFEWKNEMKELGLSIANDYTREEIKSYAEFREIRKSFLANGEVTKLINGKIEVRNRGLLNFDQAKKIAEELRKNEQESSSPEMNETGKRTIKPYFTSGKKEDKKKKKNEDDQKDSSREKQNRE